MNHNTDIAIIGAGAAGLAAAIFAAETNPTLNIVILDGAKTIGAKILVSGGGRCNVTNAQVTPSDFHAPKRIVERILKRFNEKDTVSWFASLGVELKQEESGKIFPHSNKARTVLTALLQRSQTLGINIWSHHRVQQIICVDSNFRIIHDKGDLLTSQIIMATGGQSLPKTGSDGQGWTLIRQLGHTVTPTFPALVPLLLKDRFFHQGLSGISHEATLTTRVDLKIVDSRSGSLLWTHFGISGPLAMDASRFWTMATYQGGTASVTLSCFPKQSFEEVDRWLLKAARSQPCRTVETLLSQHVPNRLVTALCDHLTRTEEKNNDKRVPPLNRIPIVQLTRIQRQALGRALTELPLPIIADRGWNFAEVTAGGVPLSEINPSSMASRTMTGLYIIGEMLDCDGRIGGFNFQWAWATGYIAGISAARNAHRS
ncbi:MAG: NAD(P)/FAD-dependent oxidoreductase [Nitrospirota bacterium]|nr:NAD(P)/FAD-dependent oxidoreductase [Nitrospirota bacterium]